MTEMLADVNVPYRVVYIPRRGRTQRSVKLWTKRKLSIASPSAAEAPPAFRVTSAKRSQQPRSSYDIRSNDGKLWWPVIGRDHNPLNAGEFLAGLASGTYESLHVLDPELLWFSGHRPTFEEYFDGAVGGRILENRSENSFSEIQRGAARIMLCGDIVHFAGGAPVFFGCRSDRSSDRSMSIHVGNLACGSEPRLLGPGPQTKEDARWEGHVFDLARFDREIALLKSRGLSIDLVHEVESLRGIALGDEGLRSCADAVLRRLLATSSVISAAYRTRIPDRSRRDLSEWVPLDICRTILGDAVQRTWPKEPGSKHIWLALTCASYVLKRLDLKGRLDLAAEDEVALASMAVGQAVMSGNDGT